MEEVRGSGGGLGGFGGGRRLGGSKHEALETAGSSGGGQKFRGSKHEALEVAGSSESGLKAVVKVVGSSGGIREL